MVLYLTHQSKKRARAVFLTHCVKVAICGVKHFDQIIRQINIYIDRCLNASIPVFVCVWCLSKCLPNTITSKQVQYATTSQFIIQYFPLLGICTMGFPIYVGRGPCNPHRSIKASWYSGYSQHNAQYLSTYVRKWCQIQIQIRHFRSPQTIHPFKIHPTYR